MNKLVSFFAARRKMWLVVAALVGALLLAGGYHLLAWKSPQVDYYNLGIKAYENGDMPQAIQYFDKSIAAYRESTRASWVHRFIYPQPDKELAAMAYFQKGKAHLQNRQAELCVESFKESLRLNPGNLYLDLSPEELQRLNEEALVVKYDLEMLFKSRPDQAAQQGKGKGKGKGQGNKQVPGNEPGSQPGKGNRDDI
ncbi:MAG TPA: tetratricopeptide repeat protein [Candidatus Obscuribacterales bacterium]